MIVRNCALAFIIATAAFTSTSASAFFMRGEDRPPPNGANGLSANGFSVTGFTSEVTVVKAVTLSDGTRVVLK